MRKICVFAGSNLGERPEFKEQAIKLGQMLVQNHYELVYGGSCVGLMGEVANEVLRLGGRVTGVMPRGLFRGEIVHEGLTELIEVETMHERKAKMGELADAFIALPGGYGTFEELFEVVCWSQIGIHDKPVGLLNVKDFYEPILQMVNRAAEEGFMNPSNKELIVSADDAEELLRHLKNYQRPVMGNKWKQLS
ncbi:TIGR00730 family Rossman fold protein [Bacillus cytotoxicus]|uniref:LOG family protein n=1 Tax=Bacillus cytotoxicus TaxID=580165 RepID=UPI000660DD08|nr:TIGR00730 family Rossman fold protein [Bacillus cytotoxicus]AWC34463.1 TIGR00730 family Rossman fold protein [Bacillus cytotoxicus]AWC38461.1 TIGR00730 family Rossman fold protein [Bacillus cytotoxicus]AWC62678.1 TIGR00730 family Rossman fold protein [Bacillus cytotoxicus]KMT49485.1 lysine decarboxylase [Bacillus cytotoxicus]MDH2880890.1 TIGR00730 family Rossman fold protein [Bacillus cytotoxicus]